MSYVPPNPNGQATSANSAPVVVASDQSAIPVKNQDGSGTALTSTGGALDVNLKSSGASQTVSGTVTANAGTNLNTSTLALETGGNLATIAGAVSSATVQGNVKQINGVTPLMGNGTTGTGSQRVTVASDNTPFQVAASNETSTIYNGTTALTPQFAVITASASGATTIVAAVSSKKIRVVALSLMSNAAVNVKFQSHLTPTDITGLYYLAANGGFVLPYNEVGWFQTVSGEALNINLSGAIAVGGSITYVAV